jgi:primosomal protein N' (replication factor Y)
MTDSGPILRVALPVPLPQLFDYLALPETTALPGCRVSVLFGHRRMTGVVMQVSDQSDWPVERLSSVLSLPDEGRPVFPPDLLSLLEWCCRYYKHPPGEVVFNAVPPPLRRAETPWPKPPMQHELTPAGRLRLEQPAGRAPAQWALLDAMRNGPAGAETLSRLASGWTRVMARLREQGWVRETLAAAAKMSPLPGPELTSEQADATKHILEAGSGFHCHLLDGITGSGKTEVYLRILEKTLAAGRQALVLVPEIGLAPQLLRRFRERLGFEPVVAHSGLTGRARLLAWEAARSGRARLVIGTRSALFMPLSDPGLIILDEEHDASFKQQDGFRYSARDVAVKRAANLDIPIILGSATPSLESLSNARSGRYQWHRLRQRATGAVEPAWRVQDLRQQTVEQGLTRSSLHAIKATLERGEQALVFLNRRGYAPVLLCHECGWHAACERCDANMTWHRASASLRCHHCTARQPVPRLCPECRADAVQGAGQGTEQLESALSRRFPDTPLLRFDRDNTRGKGDFERQVAQARRGEPCVLVGTQMLAKGHHLPKITLVVIVNLDQALYSADYRALERMGQLMVQVAGRAGREEHSGEVILQTHHPDHPDLELLMRHGYEAFGARLLEERQLADLPPFSYQALLRADAHGKAEVERFLSQARGVFPGGEAQLLGPVPALMERRRGRIHWYLLVQSSSRSGLHAQVDLWLPEIRSLPSARHVRWVLDMDPREL